MVRDDLQRAIVQAAHWFPEAVELYRSGDTFIIVHEDDANAVHMIAVNEVVALCSDIDVHIIKRSDWERSNAAWIVTWKAGAVKIFTS